MHVSLITDRHDRAARPRYRVVPGESLRTRAAVLLLAAASLAACQRGGDAPAGPAGSAQAATAAPAQPADPMSIVIPPQMASRVTVGAVPLGESVEALRIPGRLDKNLNRTARIGAAVSGRIARVQVVLGQDVRQGQVLAELGSQELATQQLAFLKAASAEQLQARAVERAELLLASDVIGSAELQRRQNELSVARAERRAAYDQLRTVGLSDATIGQIARTGHINSTLPITATRAGTVVERPVSEGQVVQPSDALFVVSDLSTVWAVADVPEQEAGRVKVGQRVQVEVPALDDERIEGKIVYIADLVNPETRTVRVGVDMDNAQRRLKPQMLITMRIEARRSERPMVPAAAVVREQDQDHVFVVDAANRATLRRVRLAPDHGGNRALLDRLPDDARIVLDGAFHLNNERQRRNLEGGAQATAQASGAQSR